MVIVNTGSSVCVARGVVTRCLSRLPVAGIVFARRGEGSRPDGRPSAGAIRPVGTGAQGEVGPSEYRPSRPCGDHRMAFNTPSRLLGGDAVEVRATAQEQFVASHRRRRIESILEFVAGQDVDRGAFGQDERDAVLTRKIDAMVDPDG
jgi:hypothetical protein